MTLIINDLFYIHWIEGRMTKGHMFAVSLFSGESQRDEAGREKETGKVVVEGGWV